MPLSPLFYKTRKSWAVGPLTINGARITGVADGSMACYFYDRSGTLVATVDGVYTEVDSQDYFTFVIGSDEQDDFVECGTYNYEHVLTVSGQERMPTPGSASAADWKGTLKFYSRQSDS